MAKLVEFDVEIHGCDGSIANAKMVWQSLMKGQRVKVPINDRDWSPADVIEVIRQVSEGNADSYKAIVREVESSQAADAGAVRR